MTTRMVSRFDARPGAVGPWRRRLLPGLTALALAAPNIAYPHSLQQLLLMPLERLLQLEFSPLRTSQRETTVRAAAVPRALDRGQDHAI